VFQYLKKYQKILLLAVLFTLVFLLEFNLHKYNLSNKQPVINIIISLLECSVLMLTGFFYFQTYKFHRISSSYYNKRTFETKNYFRFLGVPIFQVILINSFMRYINPRVYLKGRKRDYIKILHEETRQSETAHIISLIVTIPFQTSYFLYDKLLIFSFLTFFSIFFNVYPILLQRMNRFALEERFHGHINNG
jgi:hypothetical protein